METALELLLVVMTHPARFQETDNRAEHLRIEMEAQLTSQQVEEARIRVRARTFDDVMREILK